jgi:hypothetical protein
MTAFHRPTIQELVPGYLDVGITKRNAVRYIVDSHLRSRIGRGHGHKATRRMVRVELLELPIRGVVLFPPSLRDQMAELFSEGRSFDRAFAANHHD